MSVEIETLSSVRKQIGKEFNKIAQAEVHDLLNKGTAKTKSKQFDFGDDDDDDEFLNDNDVMDLSDNENPNSVISEEEAEKTIARIEAREAFDIFTEVGDFWEKKGQVVRYDINKGNKLLTKKDHPYSWEDIQKEFGGGNYKVMARLPSDGNKYLKGQSKSLHNSPEASPDYLIKNLMDKNKLLSEEKTNQGFNMQEVLETVRRTNEASIEQANRMRQESIEVAENARRQAKEEAKETISMYEKLMDRQKSTPDLMTQLAPLLTAILPKLLERPAPVVAPDNSKVQFDMMMKIQQMNMDMMEKSNEANREMFRNLQETIKDMNREKKSSNGTGDMSSLEMYKMLKDAESSGFEQMKMLNELAREQAIEREELRGERNNNDTPAEKESTIDTLLKGMIPVLAGKLGGSAPQATNVARPAVAQRAAPQVLPSQRGAVSRDNNGIRSHEGRTNGTTVQTPQARTNERNNFQGQTGSQPSEKPLLNTLAINPPVGTKKDFLNAGDDVLFDASTIPTFHKNEEVATPVEVKSAEKNLKNAEEILTIVTPVALNGYTTDGSTIDGIANEAITALQAQGIDLTTVERDFDDETLSGILSAVPEDLQGLIKDLKNAIIKKINGQVR